MFSKELEQSIANLFDQAQDQNLEYLTIEHLLLMLISDFEVRQALETNDVNLATLRENLEEHVRDNTPTKIDSKKPVQPTYNGAQIKFLSAHFGTDINDGRRLKEQELDIASDFITNFLYKIFLRRYPVFDFTNSQYPGNGYTWMGTITDTHFSSQTVTIYGGGSSPPAHFNPYTRTTTTLADDNFVTTTSSHFQFVGLRGQANVKVRNPTL